MQGLHQHGLTPFHRLAYAPVRAFIVQPTTFDDLIEQLDTAEAEAEAAAAAAAEAATMEAIPALA
jgi:hypothetical protein